MVVSNRTVVLNKPKRETRCRISLRSLIIIVVFISTLIFLLSFFRTTTVSDDLMYKNGEILDFSTADNITGFDHYIVPNIVHFVHFDKPELDFIEVVCIKAAYLHQKPDKIMIHCNYKKLVGKYWDMVRDIPTLELHYLEKPTHIFGKKFSQVYHASDIARIRVLMKYGGIYLDSDTYIVQSLDRFRKYEMTLGWAYGQYIGTQILIANKDARFFPLYINTYHQYDGSKWYYNGAELPTKLILFEHPELVHRVPVKFGVQNEAAYMLYSENSQSWREFYAVHLLVRHKGAYALKDDKITEFDEENIKTYNTNFGQMARLVLYGTTNLIK